MAFHQYPSSAERVFCFNTWWVYSVSTGRRVQCCRIWEIVTLSPFIRISGTEAIATVTKESPCWTLSLPMWSLLVYRNFLNRYISNSSVVSGWSIRWLTYSLIDSYRRNAANNDNLCTLLSSTSQKYWILWAEMACSKYLRGLVVLWNFKIIQSFHADMKGVVQFGGHS